MQPTCSECSLLVTPSPGTRAVMQAVPGARAAEPILDWWQLEQWGVNMIAAAPAGIRDVIVRTCDPFVVVRRVAAHQGDKVYARIGEHPIIVRTLGQNTLNYAGLVTVNTDTMKFTAFVNEGVAPDTTAANALLGHEMYGHLVDFGWGRLYGKELSAYHGFLAMVRKYKGAGASAREVYADWAQMAVFAPQLLPADVNESYQRLHAGQGWFQS